MTVNEKVDTTAPPGKVRAIAVFPLGNDMRVFAGDFDSLDAARTKLCGNEGLSSPVYLFFDDTGNMLP
jgi:hypothetical protein